MAKKSAVLTASKSSEVPSKFKVIEKKVLTLEVEGPQDDIMIHLLGKNKKSSHWLAKFKVSKFPFEGFTSEDLRKFLIDCNPRIFQRRSKITKEIAKTLKSSKENFADMSHPIHAVGSISRKNGRVVVHILGIMDGGHRIRTIMECILDGTLKPHHEIFIHIYENYSEEMIHKIAKNLNAVRQLQPKTITHYDGGYEIFAKAWPDLFAKGHDGKFKVTENQTKTNMDIDDFVILLVAANPDWLGKNTITAFACSRSENKEKFADSTGLYNKLYPTETLRVLGKVVDYVQYYLSEAFEKDFPKLVKASRAKTRHLWFIDKDTEYVCKEKGYQYALVAAIMKKELEKKGKGFAWRSRMLADPEKYVRQLIYDIKTPYAKIAMADKYFSKQSPLWEKVIKLVKKGA